MCMTVLVVYNQIQFSSLLFVDISYMVLREYNSLSLLVTEKMYTHITHGFPFLSLCFFSDFFVSFLEILKQRMQE